MYLPLRIKFLLVAAGVAVAALGSALWAVSYQLESRMAMQIAGMLTGAESTFVNWKNEHQKHLQAESRIVAHDPRFFAAVAEGDEAEGLFAATLLLRDQDIRFSASEPLPPFILIIIFCFECRERIVGYDPLIGGFSPDQMDSGDCRSVGGRGRSD